MNEKLQEALLSIINKTIAVTGQATDFLLTEVPEVIQQLLMWKMAESLILVILSSILGIVIMIVSTVIFRRVTKVWQQNPVVSGLDYTILVVGNFIGILVVVCNFNLTWLQIWLAPKVYLVEYAASLVK